MTLWYKYQDFVFPPFTYCSHVHEGILTAISTESNFVVKEGHNKISSVKSAKKYSIHNSPNNYISLGRKLESCPVVHLIAL